MKKFLFAAMAVFAIFALIGCAEDSGGGSSTPPAVTTWNISYDANGWTGAGVPTAAKTVTKGQALSTVTGGALPVLTDTTTQFFGGWSLTSDGEAVTDAYVPQANITLHVLWEAAVAEGDPITIEYHANGWTGSGVPTEEGEGISGTALTADLIPTLTDTATQTFVGWATTPTGTPVTTAFIPRSNISLYVRWTPVGGGEERQDLIEKLVLGNGSYALYKFTPPAGVTWADVLTLSYDLKVDAENIAIVDAGLRSFRLMGVYSDDTIKGLVSADGMLLSDNALEDRAPVPYLNMNTNFINNQHILDNSKSSKDTLMGMLEADVYVNVSFSVAGTKPPAHADHTQLPAGESTGPWWFGIGIPSQDGNTLKVGIVQTIKNPRLIGYEGVDTIYGTVPTGAEPLYAAMKNDNVQCWRGPETQVFDREIEPYAHGGVERSIYPWPEPAPALYSRGEPPAKDALIKVDLGATPTVVNNANQKGWKADETADKPVTKDQLRFAWYLVLKVDNLPAGGGAIIWREAVDVGGWNSVNIFSGTGAAVGDWVEIDTDESTITILLTEMANYEKFIKNAHEKGLEILIQYYGPSGAAFDALGVNDAYILTTDEVMLEEKTLTPGQDGFVVSIFNDKNTDDETVIALDGDGLLTVTVGALDFNPSQTVTVEEVVTNGKWNAGGFTFSLPANWKEYSSIEVHYTATLGTTAGLATAQFNTKQGFEENANNWACSATAPGSGAGSYPNVINGGGVLYFETSAATNAVMNSKPGISLCVNAYNSGNTPQEWTGSITKVVLVP